jgi:hypothetical protein
MFLLENIENWKRAEQERLDEEANTKWTNRTHGNRHRNRGYALEEVENLSDPEFCRMFRMSRTKFEELLLQIEDFMPEVNVTMAIISPGSTITNRTKLSATLRWLAGGSYLDICFAWGISDSSFYANNNSGVLWPTIDAI